MTGNTPLPRQKTGSRPDGAGDERESSARVRDMFSDIAPRYDFLNHLLSFSMDKAWRRKTAGRFRRIYRRTDARILDLCSGTGDLVFAMEAERIDVIRDSTAHRTPIVGSDFAFPMIERARKKARSELHSAVFVTADALNMPFSDQSFDLVTTAFGFRNLANYEHGLLEIARILKPGGKVAILEFSEPQSGAMAALFQFYFQRVLPLIGGMISGNSAAYAYLPKSVSRFPSPSELASLMGRTGFTDIRYEGWNWGSVALHTGQTPAPERVVVASEGSVDEFGPREIEEEDGISETAV